MEAVLLHAEMGTPHYMTQHTEYSQQTAHHYAAYRPDLHARILDRCLPGNKTYQRGLDIGCGTGYSSLALRSYCYEVMGVEPSNAMLEKAMPCVGVRYCQGSGEYLPDQVQNVDLVTFAGSLFYAHIPSVVRQLERVCVENATILVYDFHVNMTALLRQADIPYDLMSSDYDHTTNFDGFPRFEKLMGRVETIIQHVSPQQAMHLLFSQQEVYAHCAALYGEHRAESQISVMLAVREGENIAIPVDLYYSVYQLR